LEESHMCIVSFQPTLVVVSSCGAFWHPSASVVSFTRLHFLVVVIYVERCYCPSWFELARAKPKLLVVACEVC